MTKTILKEIDQENWRFTLYESPDSNWYGDFIYSPQSFVDLSMLIKLSDEEKKSTLQNRGFLIELSEKIRNNHKDYLNRSLNKEDFEFDWKIKRKLIFDLTTEFMSGYITIQKTKLLSEPEWKIDSIIREVTKSQNSETEKLELDKKIEWLIENDRNPFINYAKELLADLITNEKMNSLILSMTNGKFLDSIGIYSNQSPVSEIISDYVDKISGIKI
ncbi:hypothetical protein [Flagellimonas sp.]|uniref:hypothetical protein n=1 Tax=Flagellimonas sp. TaxID=2058762 RepID=UPI003B509547